MSEVARIFIVDDEQAGREILESLLARDGHELFQFPDGESTLKAAEDLLPDLILLDVMMPGVDGFEVCRRLRAGVNTAEIPIVLVTALDDRDSRLAGLEAGADDFVTKPYDRTELRTRVRSITRLNRYRRLLLERERLQWVFENADEGYVLLNDDGTASYANPSARAWLGLENDGSGSEIVDFLSFATRRFQLQPREAWESWPAPPPPGVQRHLVRAATDASDAVWVRVQSRLIAGTPGQVLRLTDVSAEVASRADMRSMRGIFFHKLLTPLNQILGGLDLLDMVPPDEMSDNAREYVGISRLGADRLRGTVDDLLAYLQSGHTTRGELFSISELPRLVLLLQEELGVGPVALRGLAEQSDLRLWLSSRAVETILSELFENSRKFHPHQSPQIELEVERPTDDWLILRVRDDGRTLSPREIQQAWNPGFQGERYFTGEVPGSGLGLSLVAARVWAAGGRCRLYNRGNQPGTVVELAVPLAQERAAAA